MLKFLGFEQTFKNALTTLPMGGAKGVVRTSIRPASRTLKSCVSARLSCLNCGTISVSIPTFPPATVGVGGREIGFLNGMYQKLARKYHTGVLTGKGETWGRFDPPSGGLPVSAHSIRTAHAASGRQETGRRKDRHLGLR